MEIPFRKRYTLRVQPKVASANLRSKAEIHRLRSSSGFKTCAPRCQHVDGPPKLGPFSRRGLSRAAAVRVLVVEDFAPYRRFICSTLANLAGLQVIGEVSDGLEAVQKAQDLQPDLILLDVGLPTLNGIEAARRIRQRAPEAKIIFVSQESSADVVQAALNLGARGYVVKEKAASDLRAAVEAVLAGNTFVSDS
jgi:CheY-like chemotaxis protein